MPVCLFGTPKRFVSHPSIQAVILGVDFSLLLINPSSLCSGGDKRERRSTEFKQAVVTFD